MQESKHRVELHIESLSGKLPQRFAASAQQQLLMLISREISVNAVDISPDTAMQTRLDPTQKKGHGIATAPFQVTRTWRSPGFPTLPSFGTNCWMTFKASVDLHMLEKLIMITLVVMLIARQPSGRYQSVKVIHSGVHCAVFRVI